MRRLTRQEAEALPDGTKVRVTWSGGNGPFFYKIRVDKWGNRQISLDGTLRSEVDVESVANAGIGLEKPLTILEVEE